MAGFWADICLLGTALDAFYRNYRVIWLRDGTLGGNRDKKPTTQWMIEWFENAIGYTVTAREFVVTCQALQEQA
jgi:nicotinamidase-related amidase